MAVSRRLSLCLLALCFLCPLGALAVDSPADQLVLTFAGDCTLGSEGELQNYPSGFVQVVAEKGFDWPFSGVIDLFENDDLTLVNLEGTFTEHTKAASKSFTFRAPPEYADILTLGSVEAVNLANNHSIDFGEQGFNDTITALEERGVAYCATGRPGEVEVKGQRVALLGFTYPLRKDRLAVLYEQIEGFRAREDIALIVVSFHWGIEMRYKLLGDQIDAARQAIEHGADVVVGTHPHVLQGMEVYKGKPIFYSLGNFAFGGNTSPRDFDTAVIQLAYDLTGEGPRLARLEVFPYSVSQKAQGTIQDYRPVPVSDADAARVLKKLSRGAKGFPEGFFETGLWLPDTEEIDQ